MQQVGVVHAERLVACPFSVAQTYAEEYLREAGHRDRIVVRAGPLARDVAFAFAAQADATEPGRPHDELAVAWSAESRFLPDFAGTLRMRIARDQTLLIVDGRYVPPGGPIGALFDRIVGHRVAASTAGDFLGRIAAALVERERAFEIAASGAPRAK